MIALVDCDNFFASCERLFRPDIRDKPVAVLSNNDGCIIARSNEVKQLDIPMGVPWFKVQDTLTRHGVAIFSGNFALYSNISQRVLALLSRYVPQIEVYSIDEAFLNLQPLTIQNYEAWARQLRNTVYHDIGIPVSIGVAPTKTLAKLASHYAKKHQAFCVIEPLTHPRVYAQVLQETPVEDVWGVGRQLKRRFAQVGIRTAWQLSQTSEKWLQTQIGVNGSRMYRELRGEPAHLFEEEKAPRKSLVASRSFGSTIKSIHELETAVASFASQAAFRLRGHHQTASLFGVYLRFRTPEGEQKSRSAAVTLSVPTNDTSELATRALECLHELYDPTYGYKKAGVFAYHLHADSLTQFSLFDKKAPQWHEKRKDLMRALDSINRKFGSEAIHLATLDAHAKKWHAKRERMSPLYTTEWSQIPKVYPIS